jgi:CubicO group peptidase (beta-lactamase class C family)
MAQRDRTTSETRTVLIAASAFLVLLPMPVRAAALAPSDDEIRSILGDRIDKYADGVGTVVGVIDAKGPRVVAYGKREAGRPEPVDRDSVFAIASLSKIFTSLILADMVERGEVALDDPVEKYLGIHIPERRGRRITLVDLATHTSGLPRDAPIGPDGNPTRETVQFLAAYKLTHDIGTHFEYSNFGVTLLGDALARRAGLTYAQLLHAYVAKPLGLRNTSSGIDGAASSERATGHDTEFEPLPVDNFDQYGGAGSIQSTASDLLTLLSAFLGYSPSPLAPAMSRMFEVKRSRVPSYVRALAPKMNVHLGWLESREGGSIIRWADGAAPGYRSFLGIDTESRMGVAVLANADSVGVEDIGFHILNPKAPLLGPGGLHKHKEISIDPDVLNRYAGRYRFPEQKATVKRVRNHLTMSGDVDGGTPIAYFPGTERDFYSRDGFYEMHFHTDGKGRLKGFTFRNSRFSKEVTRIDE